MTDTTTQKNKTDNTSPADMMSDTNKKISDDKMSKDQKN